MICKYCGKVIDDGSSVCPYCGSELAAPAEEAADSAPQGYYEQAESYDDIPKVSLPKKSFLNKAKPQASAGAKSSAFKMQAGVDLKMVMCVLAALFSFICMLRIGAIKAEITEQSKTLSSQIGYVGSQVTSLDDRLNQIDSTVAGVQSEAYNQLASQSIVITKDVTALTGPVTAGKYNVMFIVTAKGNLNTSTSFDWQKYNEATNGWVSIVFTGNATSNDEYGLRLENLYDKTTSEYTTKLWANGITPDAKGTYRCVITDATGITKASAEAIVSVAEG